MATLKKSNAVMVLGVLEKSAKPMTAYQILQKLKRYGISGPPTVYRALEILLEQGHIHRIESINAFVACHQHEHESHPSFFVLCQDCGKVEELHDNRIEIMVREWSEKLKFSVMQQTMELLGLCFLCKQQTQQKQV